MRLHLICGVAAVAMAFAARESSAQPAPVYRMDDAQQEARDTDDIASALEVLGSHTEGGAFATTEACACGNCGGCESCGAGDGWESLFENLSIFGGLEGSKQPQDFGVNAHFGGRVHANWGIPIVRDWGIGGQIGTSFNFTDNAVQVVEVIEGRKRRQQYFTTVGLFQTTDFLRWGVAYDYLNEASFDRFNLGQWRAKIEAPVTQNDDIGVWAAITGTDDQGLFGPVPVTLRPISQGNIYWTHIWNHQARTTFWAGLSEGHHESNVALGDQPQADDNFVFGSELHIPLSDRIALFGQANFIRPADTGTVDAYLGLVYYPATSAYAARQQRFSPLFSVANNPTFAVDLFR